MRDTAGKTREASFNKSFANFIDTNGTVVQNVVVNEITKLYNSLSTEKKEKWFASRVFCKVWHCNFILLKSVPIDFMIFQNPIVL